MNFKKKKAQKGYNPLHQVRLHESMFKQKNKKRKFYLIVECQAIKVEKNENVGNYHWQQPGNNSIHLVITDSVENHQWMLKQMRKKLMKTRIHSFQCLLIKYSLS